MVEAETSGASLPPPLLPHADNTKTANAVVPNFKDVYKRQVIKKPLLLMLAYLVIQMAMVKLMMQVNQLFILRIMMMKSLMLLN